jgi:hypothetical protein
MVFCEHCTNVWVLYSVEFTVHLNDCQLFKETLLQELK